MAISIKNLYVNNTKFVPGAPIDIRYAPLTINWDYDTNSRTVRQAFFEVRIATHNTSIGTDQFLPDIFSQQFTPTQGRSWRLRTKYIDRGTLYYGQIRLKDTIGDNSSWFIFQFRVNILPFVNEVVLSPSEPSTSDDLSLSYTLNEAGSVGVKWFKNGVHMSQFDEYDREDTYYFWH